MPNTEDRIGPTHEVWTLVSALGALVPRVRIGPLVLGNTYRHPVVVANMAASADHVLTGAWYERRVGKRRTHSVWARVLYGRRSSSSL